MDDDWQRALFSQTLSDFPRATLTGILENVAACRDGRLNAIEAKFYDGLNAFYRAHAAAPLAKIAS
jgi:hypothetical protein